MDGSARKRINLEYKGFEKAKQELRSAKSAEEHHIAWRQVLMFLKGTIAALVKACGREKELKPLHWKIKNSQRSDPILNYLLHARNEEEHLEERERDFSRKEANDGLNFGGGMAFFRGSGSNPARKGLSHYRDNLMIGANGAQIFSGDIVHAQEGDEYIPRASDGDRRTVAAPMPINPRFELTPVQKQDGTVVDVPDVSDVDFEKSEEVDLALHFIEYADAWLSERIHEAKASGSENRT